MKVYIPTLNGYSDINFVSSQPIIQLKELEVDRVRYNTWKASLTSKQHRKKKISSSE